MRLLLLITSTIFWASCHHCGCDPTGHDLYIKSRTKEISYSIIITKDSIYNSAGEIQLRALISKTIQYINVGGKDSVTISIAVPAGEELKFTAAGRLFNKFSPVYAYTNARGIASAILHMNPGKGRDSAITVTGIYKGRYKGNMTLYGALNRKT